MHREKLDRRLFSPVSRYPGALASDFCCEGHCIMKIASIVLNSVLHDARVIKQAESLARAGHKLRIFGIRDGKIIMAQPRTPGGVEVVLVDWRQGYNQLRVRMYDWLLALGIAFCLFAAGLSALLLFAWRSAWSFSPEVSTGLAVFLVMLLGFLHYWLPRRSKLKRLLSGSLEKRRLSSRTSLPVRVAGWLWDGVLAVLAQPREVKTSLERTLDRTMRAKAMRMALLQELRAFAPDAVHCHDVGTLPLGLALKRKHCLKLIYDSHELHTEVATMGTIGRLVALWREQQAAPFVDVCITVNDFIAKELAERYVQLPQPVVICNATRPLEGRLDYDGRLHRAAGLDSRIRILLYQGGFTPGRGLESLVQSAALLPDGWVVVCMGWGPLEKRLRQDARLVDHEGRRVFFLPPASQQELASWTAGASLGVIPYENRGLNHWYCSPNKLWEYPLAGVPVLASPFPFMRQVIEGNRIGWLLDVPIEAQGIAARVASLSSEDLQLARQNCAQFIAKDNWEVYAERLLRLYRELPLA